jgi:hypothetical protein
MMTEFGIENGLTAANLLDGSGFVRSGPG